MSVEYRQNFETLRRVFRASDAAVLECRIIESGALMVVLGAVNNRSGRQIAIVTLPRMLDHVLGSVVLTALSADCRTVRPKRN